MKDLMTTLTQRIRNSPFTSKFLAHLRIPLYRNSYALMINTAATSLFGILYWFIAARAYPADVVGTNSAIISSMLFLAGIATLFLDGAMVRFLPKAGRAMPKVIGYSYLVSGLAALVVSAIFLLGIRLWSPALLFLRDDYRLAVTFIAGTVIICIFSEQDGALTGLRQATWVPFENSSYAFLKIILLFVLERVLTQYGIFVSWIIPAAVLIVMISLLIFRKLSTRYLDELGRHQEPIKVSEIARYAAGSYFGYLFYTAYLMIPPLIVLQMAGAKASAYFYLPWIITNSLRLFANNMSSTLVVEGVINSEKVMDYYKKSITHMARLLLPLLAILFIAAPIILQVFGKDYSTQGLSLLRILLIGSIPATMIPLHMGLMRILNHVRQTIVIQGVVAALMLTVSFWLLPKFGIAGVGWAYLFSHSVVVLFILATQYKFLFNRQVYTNPKVPSAEEEFTAPRLEK